MSVQKPFARLTTGDLPARDIDWQICGALARYEASLAKATPPLEAAIALRSTISGLVGMPCKPGSTLPGGIYEDRYADRKMLRDNDTPRATITRQLLWECYNAQDEGLDSAVASQLFAHTLRRVYGFTATTPRPDCGPAAARP